jgi:polyhydroxybutyrate depolymerase
MLIVLHGAGGSAEGLRATANFEPLTDQHGFLVVYPAGSKGTIGNLPAGWNAGECCDSAERAGIDDLAFLSGMVAWMRTQVPVDPKRIYVVGFSDGGRMAYRAACQLSATVAAVGVVSGSLADSRCTPAQRVAVLHIHGTDDAQIPYFEPSRTPPPVVPPAAGFSLPPAARFWAANNACRGGVALTESPSVRLASYSFCEPGGEVAVLRIAGGTHAWPGIVGAEPPMNELNATSAIVTFLLRQFRQ